MYVLVFKINHNNYDEIFLRYCVQEEFLYTLNSGGVFTDVS